MYDIIRSDLKGSRLALQDRREEQGLGSADPDYDPNLGVLVSLDLFQGVVQAGLELSVVVSGHTDVFG